MQLPSLKAQLASSEARNEYKTHLDSAIGKWGVVNIEIPYSLIPIPYSLIP